MGEMQKEPSSACFSIGLKPPPLEARGWICSEIIIVVGGGWAGGGGGGWRGLSSDRLWLSLRPLNHAPTLGACIRMYQALV